MVFPHQAILSSADTNWVPYKLVNSDTIHLEIASDSPKLRAQSHKAAPITTSDATHKQEVVRLPTIYVANEGSSCDPLFGFNNLLQWLPELKEAVYLLGYLFIIE